MITAAEARRATEDAIAEARKNKQAEAELALSGWEQKVAKAAANMKTEIEIAEFPRAQAHGTKALPGTALEAACVYMHSLGYALEFKYSDSKVYLSIAWDREAQ